MVNPDDLINTEWRFAWDGSAPNIIIYPLFLRPIQNLLRKFNHVPFFAMVSTEFGKNHRARFPKNFNNSEMKLFFDEKVGEYLEQYRKLMKETNDYLENYKYLLNGESRVVSAEEWKHVGELLEKNLSLYLYTQPECLEHLGDELLNLLKKEHTDLQASRLLNELSNSLNTVVSERKTDLLRIKRMTGSTNFLDEMHLHFWKYRSFYMNKLGSSISEDMKLMIHNLENVSDKNLSEIGSLGLLSSSREVVELSEKMRSLGIIRFEGKNVWMNLVLTIFNLFEQVAKQIGIEKEELEKWAYNEVSLYLKHGKYPLNFELKDIEKSIILIDKENIKFLDMEEKLVNRILSVGEKEVKGKCAYPGKVIGTAFLLTFHDNYNKKIEEMKRIYNPIIVTSQTTPREMIFIERAKGIITDEGGILSHAAIVAREYKIPTLIGTSHATTLFKNGDKIVLDCDNGIAFHFPQDFV